MKQGWEKVNKILKGICVLLMAVLIIDVFGAVVLRYVFHLGFGGTEEFALVMMVWLSFLGAVVTFIERGHVAIQYFVEKRSLSTQAFLTNLANIITAFFFIMLTYSGIEVISVTSNEHLPTLRWPFWSVYGVLPLSSFIMVLFSLNMLWSDFRNGLRRRT